MVTATGDVYIGNFQQGLLQGEGTYWWADGRKYAGNVRSHYYVNDKQCFHTGLWIWTSRLLQWNRSVQEGHATQWWPNGQVYVGAFKNGRPNGMGKLQYDSGVQVHGHFTNGEVDGNAKYFMSDSEYREGKNMKCEFLYWISMCR